MAIIILGMHRSGTSLTAKILYENGLFFGKPHEFLFSDFNNQEGYYENRKIVQLNDDILKWLKGSWLNLPKSPVDFKSIPSNFTKRAKDIVDYFSSQRHEWGFKDPRTTVLYSFWKNVLPINHKIVFCFRHPSEIENSLKERRKIKDFIDWRSLWVKYVLRGLWQTKNQKIHFVFYDNYFSKSKTIHKLLDFCELPIKNLDCVNLNLRHNYKNCLINDKATKIYNHYKSIYDLE